MNTNTTLTPNETKLLNIIHNSSDPVKAMTVMMEILITLTNNPNEETQLALSQKYSIPIEMIHKFLEVEV